MSTYEQASLFNFIDDPDVAVNDSPTESTSKNNNIGKSPKTSRVKPAKTVIQEEKFDVDAATIIRYDSENLPITNYFSLEEIANGILQNEGEKVGERCPITSEDLRKRMVDEYGELLEELCVMVFNKEKNIVVPVLQARKKGAKQ